MIEEPAKRWFHATGIPFPSRPAESRSKKVGRYMSCWDIFLARPDHLHRTLDLHGDLDGSGDAVDLEPAAEAAAEQMVVHHHLVQRQAGGLRRRRLGSRDD